MRPRKKQKQMGGFSIPSLIFAVLMTIVSVALAWKIIDYLRDEHKSQSYWDALPEFVVVERESAPLAVSAEPHAAAESPVPEPAPVIPEAIDFDRLREISPDVIAWLLSPGTQINYAIAQAEDNDYYLHRLLDGAAANGGTPFADYRCSADFSDYNTVIYGHNMKSRAMFAGLIDYFDPGFYAEHPVMYLYVPGKRYTLEMVAGYETDVYDTVFSVPATKEARDEIAARAAKRSSFDAGVVAGGEDRLVTPSTCSYDYDNARYVLIGRIT